MRGVSPEISQSTGQKLRLPDPRELRNRLAVGSEGLASENSRVCPSWVSELSNRGTSFPRLKDDLPLSGEPPVRS